MDTSWNISDASWLGAPSIDYLGYNESDFNIHANPKIVHEIL